MKNRLLYIQGYDNLIKELQTNEELRINIRMMLDSKSPLYTFYDGDKYIKLRLEEVDIEEDEFDNNIHVLNSNGIEFIDNKDKAEKIVDALEKTEKTENTEIDIPPHEYVSKEDIKDLFKEDN